MKLKSLLLAAGTVLMLGLALPARAQVFTSLHNFTNTPDGAIPGQLAWMNGVFYGSTANGGTNGNGAIFQFNTNGPVFTTIYHFTGAINSGNSPNNLLATNNLIYGTAAGGSNSLGMIFAVNTNGTGFTPLYSFGPAPDGNTPLAGLVLGGAALYGTTYTGGTNYGGTLFKINTNGTGYATLHWFTNTPDGFLPQGGLVLSGSTLYGTTSSGGTNGFGVIFAINTNGTGYTILRSFTNTPDGQNPYGGLVLNSGVLYGAAGHGGAYTNGALFAINTDGSGYRTLYSFTGFATNTDGVIPKGMLTFNGGYLYGTAISGGTGGGGTLFRISTNGTGFTVIRSFTNNAVTGSDPENGVVPLGNTLWGTTSAGGTGYYGILYNERLSPVITSQPQSVTVTNGNPATFTVNAADDSRTNYQWYFNTSTLLAGQTNNTLTLAPANTNSAGTYTVVVSDNFGSVTSSPAVLTVITYPAIAQQPQDLTVTNGFPAAFTNVASGSGQLFYQWYFNTNTPVGNGTNAILIISPATTNQAGYYTVVVTNKYGSATSSPARLTVIVPASPPTITQQPQNYTVTNGYDATFTNVASGAGQLFYQWYFNTNTPVGNGTNAILIISPATTNQAGYYSVIVTSSYGSATSSPARLTVVSTPPIIISQPQSLAVSSGAQANFVVLAAGQSLLKYQWYASSTSNSIGTLSPGQTNSTFSFTAATNFNGRYYIVVITNNLGRATSSPPAQLTVITAPLITTNPQPANVFSGAPASFTVGVLGAPILKFQWYFNTNTVLTNLLGNALPGATNATLDFSAVSNSLVGGYSVIITNIYGQATSSPVALTIQIAAGQPKLLNYSLNPASGSFSLTVTNTASSANRLWASTNLTSINFWQVIASNVMAANGLWLFTDTNIAKTNRIRFYRASSP